MSTFLQLCQKARRECGIQGSGPTAVTGQTGLLQRLVEWVADADEYVQSLHHDWDFLHTSFTVNTVLGADLLAQPADLGNWDRESFSVNRGTATGRALTLQEYKVWRQFMGLKSNAPPGALAIKPNGDLVLSQPADGVYEIGADYWKTPTRMTADASTTPIPTLFERIIIARTKMFFAEDQEFTDAYKMAEKEFKEWLVALEGAQLPGQSPRMQGEAPLMSVRPA